MSLIYYFWLASLFSAWPLRNMKGNTWAASVMYGCVDGWEDLCPKFPESRDCWCDGWWDAGWEAAILIWNTKNLGLERWYKHIVTRQGSGVLLHSLVQIQKNYFKSTLGPFKSYRPDTPKVVLKYSLLNSQQSPASKHVSQVSWPDNPTL